MTQYIYIALIAILLGLGVRLNMQDRHIKELIANHVAEIQEYQRQVEELQAKEAVSQANEARLLDTIHSLNKMIDTYKVDISKKNRELAEYKAKPDGEKYKAMYDRLKQVGEVKDDCERYKATANAFDGLDLNEL